MSDMLGVDSLQHRVLMWSRALSRWVWLVPQKSAGQNELELTPQDVDLISKSIAQGWNLQEAIFRVTGVKV